VTAKAFAAIAAAIAIVAFLILPGAAAAHRPKGPHGHPTRVELLSFWGTNGFGIEVNLVNHQALTVSASASSGPGLLLTTYTLKAPQAPGSDDIRASLGRLGRIDVRFVPKSVKEEKPQVPVCKGEKTVVEIGRFVGLIEFHGARGYTRARVTHAVGGVAVEPAPACRGKKGHASHQRDPQKRPSAFDQLLSAAARVQKPAKEEEKEEETGLVGLTAKAENPPVEFKALQLLVPGKKAKKLAFGTFSAVATRDRGRIKESSAALDLLVSGNYLRVPDLAHPTAEATVEPPSPFLGTATFQRESAHQTSWTGDLRVNLPGFGVVPLAGRGSEATMCSSLACLPKKSRHQ
jgi:hypothetical protein